MNKHVTFEIAKILKEKGFNEPCLGFYNPKNKLSHYFNPDKDWYLFKKQCLKNSDIKDTVSITAPLWQQVVDWLADQKIECSVDIVHDDYGNWRKFNIINNYYVISYKYRIYNKTSRDVINEYFIPEALNLI